MFDYLHIFIHSHWISSGNYRDELVALIGAVDWSRVNWQGMLISDWSQGCDSWNRRPPCLLKEGFSTQQLQSIPPIHLYSCLKKSNEIGWKFESKQTLSSIWFIILTLFYDWMIDNIHQQYFTLN